MPLVRAGRLWRRGRGVLAIGLAGLAVTALLAAEPAGRELPPVRPRYAPRQPDAAPFPSDDWTVPDRRQRTGRRVALPRPDCRQAPSACDEVRLLDELDGFALAPRLALPFTGPVDPGSVSPRSVFLIHLGAGPPEAVGVERVVWDPATATLYARPDALLEAETRYGLVVTRDLRDVRGRAVRAAPGFARRLVRAGSARSRDPLGELAGGLARRGLTSSDVVVGAAFTTLSVTGFLERVREGLDARPPAPAVVATTDAGAGAVFPRSDLRELWLERQARMAASGPDAIEDLPLPLAALDPTAVATLAVGWYRSPWYLTPERRIEEGPTAAPLPPPRGEAAVPFLVLVPAGSAPPGGWPVVVVGHGYGGDPFTMALLVGGTLARHGLATVAIPAVGHGGGPGSRLRVIRRNGAVVRVPVPGRGADVDGDGRIERVEGLAAVGSAGALGLRDGLRQQVVDLAALVRALRDGLDVDGDGVRDLRADRVGYLGHSLGAIYGTLWTAVDGRVRAAVLNAPGGPVPEIARLAPVFRPLLRRVLARRVPPLLNAGDDFREDLPLAGDPPVSAPAPGAVAVQEFLARAEWLGRRGDPVAWARHLRRAPLGAGPKPVLIQAAFGDSIVPNVTTATLVRAGDLWDATVLVPYDRLAGRIGDEAREAHGFLLRLGAPGLAGALARAAQEQAARFLSGDGNPIWAPDNPGDERLFEVPAHRLGAR